MPDRAIAPLGAPCWIELFTSDPDRSLAFYSDLFGWTAEHSGEEYGGYINLYKDGQRAAGCMRNDAESGSPDTWSVYLATADARATADAAVAAGGQVVVAPMQVGDLGTMAFLVDAGGAAVGAWQPGTNQGFQVLTEPGTAAWFELHTRDYAATVEFYESVFGWDTQVMSDAPGFRSTTLGQGEERRAGIMDVSPHGMPVRWWVSFSVEDVNATLARAVELGGTVVDAAEDTPFGRLATVADPTGAVFKLQAP